jgi:hypothetical protein
LVEIKAREKFNRRHLVDIPRIKFFAQVVICGWTLFKTGVRVNPNPAKFRAHTMIDTAERGLQ